jgi:sigma-B regulation protein RsbU (phosphoserine phosphatase)
MSNRPGIVSSFVGEIRPLERRIKRVESVLILLAIAAIASGDYLFGPSISLGYLYLIPLSYSALTHRWRTTLVLAIVCIVLRQWLGPLEQASWGLIARDWVLTFVFLGVVTALHRLGVARTDFFERARQQRDELVREVEMAARVQQHLLDRHQPPAGLLDVVAHTRPAKVVGGDYYDFIQLGEDRFGLVIADVSGKGLPAALIMPAVQISTRTLAAHYSRLSDVLRELNNVLVEALELSSYVTLFFGVFDVKSRTLTFSNAGHQPVLHFEARSGKVNWLSRGGTAVGLLPMMEYDTAEVAFDEGDIFVFYTDGIVEPENLAGEEYGQERLAELIKKNRSLSARDLVSAIHLSLDSFRNLDVLGDDRTVIVVGVPPRA